MEEWWRIRIGGELCSLNEALFFYFSLTIIFTSKRRKKFVRQLALGTNQETDLLAMGWVKKAYPGKHRRKYYLRPDGRVVSRKRDLSKKEERDIGPILFPSNKKSRANDVDSDLEDHEEEVIEGRIDTSLCISNTLLCSSKTTCVNFAENTKYII